MALVEDASEHAVAVRQHLEKLLVWQCVDRPTALDHERSLLSCTATHTGDFQSPGDVIDWGRRVNVDVDRLSAEHLPNDHHARL